MKRFLILVTLVGLSVSFNSASPTEKAPRNGRNRLKEDENLSPLVLAPGSQNGLIEVKENEIPDGVVVYVMEELKPSKQDGESLSTADNIVFRPLFQYRNKQEALARRRVSNGYRRRYFVQRRPYRNAYYVYYPHRWN